MEDINNSLKAARIRIGSDLVGNGHILKVYHNDVLCKIAKVDSKPAAMTAGYQAMLNDVYKIQAYTELGSKIVKEKLQKDLPIIEFRFDDQDQLICSSLYLSAITLYGKCFTSAEGRVARLQEDQVLKRMSEDQQKKHSKFIDLRHNWAGHGGSSSHELLCGIVAFLPDNKALPLYPALSTGFSVAESFEDLLELSSILVEEIEHHKRQHSMAIFKDRDQKEYLHKLLKESAFFLHIENPQPEKKSKVKRKKGQRT